MLRVLHLLDPHDGIEPVLACREALTIAGAHHELWLVTDSAGEHRAAQCGLPSTDRVGTILGRPESAGRGLRALLEHRTDDLGEPAPDLVQCWSVRMLGAARAAFGKRTIPRCGFLARPPLRDVIERSESRRFSKTAEERALDDTTLLTLDLDTRAGWAPMASAGRGAMRMRDNIRVAPEPPIDSPPGDRQARRAAAREALGLDAADLAVVLLADPPRAGDAMRFAFQIGLQHVGGVRIVGVTPRGTSHSRRGARFVAGHGRRWGLIETSHPIDQVLDAADVALWDVPETGPVYTGATLLVACIARLVPVAAAAHPVSAHALRGVPECIARDATTRSVAGKLFEFANDAAARACVASRMVDLSRELRERDSFRRTLLALWQERANVPIARPGLPTPVLLAGAGA